MQHFLFFFLHNGFFFQLDDIVKYDFHHVPVVQQEQIIYWADFSSFELFWKYAFKVTEINVLKMHEAIQTVINMLNYIRHGKFNDHLYLAQYLRRLAFSLHANETVSPAYDSHDVCEEIEAVFFAADRQKQAARDVVHVGLVANLFVEVSICIQDVEQWVLVVVQWL